jgi:hypothetical protein
MRWQFRLMRMNLSGEFKMAFTSNLAAINAANATLKQIFSAQAPSKDQLKMLRADHFAIEKLDGEWHARIIKPFPKSADIPLALHNEKSGAFAFPQAEAMAQIRADAAAEQDAEQSPQPEVSASQPAAGQAAFANAAAFFASRQQAITADLPESDEPDEPDEPSAADFQAKHAEIVADAENEFANAQAQADKQANAHQTSELKNGKIWIHASSCASPVKRVWAIADAMIQAAAEQGKERPSRKEIQDECVRQGVASGTARTQYQAWKKANDNDAANAENAAALSAALNAKRA